MLLDNEKKTENQKPENTIVAEWLKKRTDIGELYVVTGYFTIGAMAYVAQNFGQKITHFKFVLGDIVSTNTFDDYKALDLLNEDLGIEQALQISKIAKHAVDFIKQEKVELKTLEPNFCHAKLYLFASRDDDAQKNYYIMGSSNLTEAGIGLKHTSNIELNVANFGSQSEYNDLYKWFDALWQKPQAHKQKTIQDTNGKIRKVDFKQYLIDEISKIFKPYTPEEIYFKILFELYAQEILLKENDPDFARKIGRLENTKIFQNLYPFQQKAVRSLVATVDKYGGAILADAVGLGKTWTALAVMKYYQQQGQDVILLCPKKLEQNWRKFLKDQLSKFEEDKFDYKIRFHTDMFEGRLQKELPLEFFRSDRPKLLVIDESHNFRNDKSKRYQFLVEQILERNEDIKVLLLSATPINTSLIDIRNQFKLMSKGTDTGFRETLQVRNIYQTFRKAQQHFNEWRNEENKNIATFIQELSNTDFFRLTDKLVVARTRKMIEGLAFPHKEKPINQYITPTEIGNYENFDEIFKDITDIKLSAYQPSFYVAQDQNISILENEQQRDFYLARMMYILIIKRLESSWYAFKITVGRIQQRHQQTLDAIRNYQNAQKKQVNVFDESEHQAEEMLEEDEIDLSSFTLGKKRKINIQEIEQAGKLELFKQDLKNDLDKLDKLVGNIKRLDDKIKAESNHKSQDQKLGYLIKVILEKQKMSNPKIIIFTAYKDTAIYLFDELKKRKIQRMAMVSGDESKVWDNSESTQYFEPFLERFAPFTKLFMEKEWKEFSQDTQKSPLENFEHWKTYIQEKQPNTYQKLQNPIDILITTDVLSEGQNLQDANLLVNYDIHWNPVRLIQRMGRIDRIGSPNTNIKIITIWPQEQINTYLDLQERIEDRMAMMTLAGAEIPKNLTDRLKEKLGDNIFEEQQNKKMLEKIQTDWENAEVAEDTLGFDDFSLETFRQDLQAELDKTKDKFRQMPNGVFSGFVQTDTTYQEGIIALVGYPKKPQKASNFGYQKHELIYINEKGENILNNQKEILDFLAKHKTQERNVPKGIDNAQVETIQKWVKALKSWIEKPLQNEEDKQPKEATLDFLDDLSAGNLGTIEKSQREETLDHEHQSQNYDLLAWLLIQ